MLGRSVGVCEVNSSSILLVRGSCFERVRHGLCRVGHSGSVILASKNSFFSGTLVVAHASVEAIRSEMTIIMSAHQKYNKHS
jgi:hypothetical protein